jgi:hypothetical protein
MGEPASSKAEDQPDHDGRGRRGRRAQGAETTAPVEEAIQTGCSALVALQASLASAEEVPGRAPPAEAALKAAIELVRIALSDLRESTASGERSPLSLGFVFARRASDEAD